MGVLNVLLLLGGGHWRVLIEKQGLQFLLLFLRLHSEFSTVDHWVAASQVSCAVSESGSPGESVCRDMCSRSLNVSVTCLVSITLRV